MRKMQYRNQTANWLNQSLWIQHNNQFLFRNTFLFSNVLHRLNTAVVSVGSRTRLPTDPSSNRLEPRNIMIGVGRECGRFGTRDIIWASLRSLLNLFVFYKISLVYHQFLSFKLMICMFNFCSISFTLRFFVLILYFWNCSNLDPCYKTLWFDQLDVTYLKLIDIFCIKFNANVLFWNIVCKR